MRHPQKPNQLLGAARGSVLSIVPMLVLSGLAPAQQDEWEWEPDEGYHREEWYDPGDWFNEDDRISYESDWYDYDYDLDDDHDTYDGYGHDYDYHDGSDYGWHYEWNPHTDRWESDYGWHDDAYEDTYGHDPYGPDYGWHYEWNPRQDRWESEYGWHDRQYELTSEQDRDTRSGQRQDQRQDRSEPRGDRPEAMFSGRIESFQRVNLEGQKVRHTLVRLRTRDGRSRIVNLGPRVGPQQLDIQQGDDVTVRGRRGEISGKEVVMASAIRVDGERTRLRQQQMQDRQQRQQQAQVQQEQGTQEQQKGDTPTVTFSGQLDGFKKMSMQGQDGSREDHLFVRMRLQDGSQRVVDLGPTARMGQLDLSQGDRVKVQGCPETIDGRKVLVAEKLRVEGERMALDPRQRGQGSQGSSSGPERQTSGAQSRM